MFRPVALTAGLAGLAMAAGCVNVMEQTAISQIAPEWFEAKTAEVKGEGYPELADIPEVRPFSGTAKQWQGEADGLKASAEELEKRAELKDDHRTPDDIRATAAQWRALAEGRSPSPAGEPPGR